jgi:hypothetical protein
MKALTKRIGKIEERLQIGIPIDISSMTDVELKRAIFRVYKERKAAGKHDGEIEPELVREFSLSFSTWTEVARHTEIRFFEWQASLSACKGRYSEEYRVASEICAELLAMGVKPPDGV